MCQVPARSMPWLYKMFSLSVAKLTSSRRDKWLKLSRWWTSISLSIEGNAAFQTNEKRSVNTESWKVCKKNLSLVFPLRKENPSGSLSGSKWSRGLRTEHLRNILIIYVDMPEVVHASKASFVDNSRMKAMLSYSRRYLLLLKTRWEKKWPTHFYPQKMYSSRTCTNSKHTHAHTHTHMPEKILKKDPTAHKTYN